MEERRIKMLRVNSLTKKYKNKVVFDDLTFSVNKGEMIGLVGENGAGKSTLLNILATLQKPSRGTVTFNNKPFANNMNHIRKQIGFVPQDIAIWEEFTVEENMIFFEKLSWTKKNKKQLKQLCLDMKLDHWDEQVKILSGGMKRKLNLAISLIHEPDLLLLDEPTVGIDLKSRKEIGSYLRNLALTEDKIIIYTSHDMDEIKGLCDRVMVLGEDPFYHEFLLDAGKELISF